MTIERFHTGPRMSQMVVHNGTVYLAGQVAQTAAGASVAKQTQAILDQIDGLLACLLYTSPSPRDKRQSRMPSSA